MHQLLPSYFFLPIQWVPCGNASFKCNVSSVSLSPSPRIKLFTKIISFSRKQFEKICKREVEVPGITIMRDVAIAKSEFVPDQKAVTKIQTWHEDDVLWEYCCLPEVRPRGYKKLFHAIKFIMLINL